MENKNKVIVGVIFLCVIVSIILMFYSSVIPIPGFIKKGGPSSIREAIQIIKDNNVDLIVFGEDIPFEDDSFVRKIDQLNDNTLQWDKNKQHSYLVINDLSGSVTLTEETIQLIHDYIYNKGYHVMYFGDKYLNIWEENQNEVDVDGNMCKVYQNENGRVVGIVGGWTHQEQEIAKENPYLQSEVIIYQAEDFMNRSLGRR